MNIANSSNRLISPTVSETEHRTDESASGDLLTEVEENIPFQNAAASTSAGLEANAFTTVNKNPISLEEQRMKNIESNMKFLQHIGLSSTIEMQSDFSQNGKDKKAVPAIAKRTIVKKTYVENVLRRKSLRSATYVENVLSRKSLRSVNAIRVVDAVAYQNKSNGASTVSHVSIKPLYFGKLEDFSLNDSDRSNRGVLSSSANLNSFMAEPEKTSKKPPLHTTSYETISSIKSLKYTNVAKCCPGRIWNTQFLPSWDNLMVAACDSIGNIGFWKIPEKEYGGDESSSTGSFVSQSHVGHVRSLKFSPVTETQLFSCGSDGTLKCTDLIKGQFFTVYKTTHMKNTSQFGVDDITFNWFDFSYVDKRTIYIADNRGLVHLVDVRMEAKNGNATLSTDSCGVPLSTFYNGFKPVKCLSAHPSKPYLLAADSLALRLWDLRYTKYTCINQHRKAAHGAFFSPVTGDKILTTCTDNHLRVFDSSKLTHESFKLLMKIKHCNSGRSVSPFQAIWHPTNEEVFVIGSLDQQRRKLDVFTTQSLVPACNLEGHDSFCSRNAIHPYYNIVAGSSSSGKVYIWR